ncbi:hypothetical protein BASA62_005134 [Batrachochytrium salamandrivorans]|nr:hypothetical protein BASA62_005134 [Batrachochytrium salamandrivorans]
MSTIMSTVLSLLLSLMAITLSIQGVYAADFEIPSGAVLPAGLPNPLPNANSFRPERPSDNAPVSPTTDQSHPSTFKTYHFAATLFLIILGSIFVVAGIAVGILVLLRWMRSSEGRLKEEERKFELEQENLTQRTATISRRQQAKIVQRI